MCTDGLKVGGGCWGDEERSLFKRVQTLCLKILTAGAITVDLYEEIDRCNTYYNSRCTETHLYKHVREKDKSVIVQVLFTNS